MGTNYYFYANKCEHCGRTDERVHIGKSSAGWYFLVRVYPQSQWEDELQLPRTYQEWKALFPKGEIRDEYDRVVSTEAMIATIEERGHPKGDAHWEDKGWLNGYPEEAFHNVNHSERGIRGLLRNNNRSSWWGNIVHGEGPWSESDREFS